MSIYLQTLNIKMTYNTGLKQSKLLEPLYSIAMTFFKFLVVLKHSAENTYIQNFIDRTLWNLYYIIPCNKNTIQLI